MALIVLSGPLAAAAAARVTLVAPGTPQLVFLGIADNEVVARLALPGAARAVAIARDGAEGFVSAGDEVVAIDVNGRRERGRSALGAGPPIADVALSPGGQTLYAVRGAQLLVLDTGTLAQLRAIELRGESGELAISPNGARAAVALASGHIAIVDLRESRLRRRVPLKGATGVAIAGNGNTYATARGRLRVIARGERRARKRPIELPDGAGGGLALSPGGSRLVVGAARGGRTGAIVELRTSAVRRLVAGSGPEASRGITTRAG